MFNSHVHSVRETKDQGCLMTLGRGLLWAAEESYKENRCGYGQNTLYTYAKFSKNKLKTLC